LVVLLDRLHYDKQDRPFMHSRSYFIQGLFTFTGLRSTGAQDRIRRQRGVGARGR